MTSTTRRTSVSAVERNRSLSYSSNHRHQIHIWRRASELEWCWPCMPRIPADNRRWSCSFRVPPSNSNLCPSGRPQKASFNPPGLWTSQEESPINGLLAWKHQDITRNWENRSPCQENLASQRKEPMTFDPPPNESLWGCFIWFIQLRQPKLSYLRRTSLQMDSHWLVVQKPSPSHEPSRRTSLTSRRASDSGPIEDPNLLLLSFWRDGAEHQHLRCPTIHPTMLYYQG